MFHKFGDYSARNNVRARPPEGPSGHKLRWCSKHLGTVFKLHFGNLTLKAYTKGERLLRFEAIVHNTHHLGCGRVVARFPKIVARLRDMLERFLTTLDCVDVAFISDETVDQFPLPSIVGKTHVGGVDLNKPRIRKVLAAGLALAPSPKGFSVSELTAKVRTTITHVDQPYTIRQAAYDLKKLRAKGLIAQAGRSRRYAVQADSLRAIAALLILREQVILPILAGVRSPRIGRRPKTWTTTDRHYERLRIQMQPLLDGNGLAA
jgi:hypothetical protein